MDGLETMRGGRLKVAFLGSRGIPACYIGFETFYENLSTRLAARGHEVTVYNRRHFIAYTGDTYDGVRLVSLPTIRTKHEDRDSVFVASPALESPEPISDLSIG